MKHYLTFTVKATLASIAFMGAVATAIVLAAIIMELAR